MDIVKGWRFYSADFSLQASDMHPKGNVTLIRGPEGRRDWHNLSEETRDSQYCPELFVNGAGKTIAEAIARANNKALKAGDVLSPDQQKGEIGDG